MTEPYNSIEAIDSDEVKISEFRKHPFGLVLIYLQFGVGIILALGLLLFLLPEYLGDQSAALNALLLVVSVVIIAFIALLMLVATYIYRMNKLIISDQNITQVAQKGLFNRQISELSLANVEDVTAEKNGFFATIFNYGVLRVETAGEQNNFHFTYCPNPDYCGKVVLDARQSFIQKGDVPASGRSNERFAARRQA